MTGIRLVLSVALPLGTALLGFLFLLSRRRGKGKGRDAVTDNDSRQGDEAATVAAVATHKGDGDKKGVSITKCDLRDADIVGQSRERHKGLVNDRKVDEYEAKRVASTTCSRNYQQTSLPEKISSSQNSSSNTGVTGNVGNDFHSNPAGVTSYNTSRAGVTANHSKGNTGITPSRVTPSNTGVAASQSTPSQTGVKASNSSSPSSKGVAVVKDPPIIDILKRPKTNNEVILSRVSESKSGNVDSQVAIESDNILDVHVSHLLTSPDQLTSKTTPDNSRRFHSNDGASEIADRGDLPKDRISALLPVVEGYKFVPKSNSDPASRASSGETDQTSVLDNVVAETGASRSHIPDAVCKSVIAESNQSDIPSQLEEVSSNKSADAESGANQSQSLDADGLFSRETAHIHMPCAAGEVKSVIRVVSRSGSGDKIGETQSDVIDMQPDSASNGTMDALSFASEQTERTASLVVDVSSKMAASSNGADMTSSSSRIVDHSDNTAVAAAVTVVTSSSESPGCDSNSEASNDSGRGGSVTEPIPLPVGPPDSTRYEFNFPSELCGRLIGKNGRNINQVKEKSGANITLKNNPCTPSFQICVIEGTQGEVDKALGQIQRKFPRHQFPQVDFTPLSQVLQETPVLMPDIMQLNLPEGVSVDIVVSNIVDAGHIFVQQPTHPTFSSLERLNHFMSVCYTQDRMVPPLPSPVEVGVICASFMVDGWFRAQVVSVSEASSEVDIKYVDYGGYSRVQASSLKQIRSDFMTLPFQAVECYMGNVTPLQEEEYFNDEGNSVLEELTQGKLLQAQVVNRAEDGIPYIHMYQISGNRVLFINREMVNRKVVRWIEILQ